MLVFLWFWLLCTIMILCCGSKKKGFAYICKWYIDTNISIFLIANTDLYKSCNQSIKLDKNFFVHRLVKNCLLSQGQKLEQKRTTIRYWDGQLNYPNVYASKWNREGMTLHFLSFLDGPFYNCYQNIRQQSNEKVISVIDL